MTWKRVEGWRWHWYGNHYVTYASEPGPGWYAALETAGEYYDAGPFPTLREAKAWVEENVK